MGTLDSDDREKLRKVVAAARRHGIELADDDNVRHPAP